MAGKEAEEEEGLSLIGRQLCEQVDMQRRGRSRKKENKEKTPCQSDQMAKTDLHMQHTFV